ncbi:MAG: ATP-dependent Clp protease proteolytic subunit [Myxococcota bacterium]|jgi:ATP-dependent Clp protease protease subunit
MSRTSAEAEASAALGMMFPRVQERLLESRILLLAGEIDSKVAENVMARLLALSADSDDDITLYLHSPGGHVESGDTLHDMVRFVGPRVRIIGTGWVASAGTHVYLAAEKEDRLCLPNTRFMIHQPLGGIGGQATDIEIEADEMLKARDRLNQTIADRTGQSVERVEKDTDRNFWMSPEEALEYGIVGRIVKSISDV